MAVKRAKGKRRGIRPGVERHKIKFKSDTHAAVDDDPTKRKILGIQVARISHLAEAYFKVFCSISCTLCILPMEYEFGGKLMMTSKRKKLWAHYAVLAIISTAMAIKGVALFQFSIEYGLTVSTLMSIGLFSPYVCGLTLGAGNFLKPRETLQLVNSWRSTLDCVGKAKGGQISGFESLPLSLKVVGVGVTVTFVPFILLTLVFLFPDLPVNTHNLVPGLGLDSKLLAFVVRVCCIPLEFVLSVLPIVNASFGAMVLIIGIGVLKVYYEGLRTLPAVQSASQRIELVRLYNCGQVYNRVLDVWYKFVVPSSFLMVGTIIVLGLYVSIRHTDLPVLIYYFFPYMATFFAAILFDLCHDGMLVIRASEDTLSALRSTDGANYSRIPVEDRMRILKGARALRPAFFNVGEFTEFNMDVPVGIWDKILNQLMFLLSL